MTAPNIAYRTTHPAKDLGYSARRIFDQLAQDQPVGAAKRETMKRLVDAGLARWTRAGRFTDDGYWQPQRIALLPAALARWHDYKCVTQQIEARAS